MRSIIARTTSFRSASQPTEGRSSRRPTITAEAEDYPNERLNREIRRSSLRLGVLTHAQAALTNTSVSNDLSRLLDVASNAFADGILAANPQMDGASVWNGITDVLNPVTVTFSEGEAISQVGGA